MTTLHIDSLDKVRKAMKNLEDFAKELDQVNPHTILEDELSDKFIYLKQCIIDELYEA